MYVCDHHGELKSEWCEGCEKIIKCDCSDVEQCRQKDVTFAVGDDLQYITIYADICASCGDVKRVSQ